MLDGRLQLATQCAEKLVRDEKLSLPVDLESLAKRYEIHLEAKPDAAIGVSGMLVRAGNKFAIGYATHIKSDGFRRFSIAHEFGHYFLPGHPEQVFKDGSATHQSRAGFGSRDQIELEADHFAAGLLMPADLFGREAGKYFDGFSAIEKLAERCQTSLTASAIRYAQITDAAVAIVVSTKLMVDYCFSSRSMMALQGYKHPSKGSMLPLGSLTRDFNQIENNVIDAHRDDDVSDLIGWFRSENEIDAVEEVVGLGGYGKTLTIITADISDEEESQSKLGSV